ncbi:MAG: polyribonucleotide nucleotidyltransferase [Candidatus Liptonbacteria bacterium]|nr:polyribonucleotide nucleotidyltransferase [Candidatus Liptonbacteria bacterium]
MNLEKKKFIQEIGGRDLIIEVSRLAEQANAAVLATYGGTTVMVTAVMGKDNRNVNFMPLTVDYEEKFYAAGKIIGSRFVRREGRPSEEAILSGRLVDRSVRPFFDRRLRRDIQLTVTVLSFDEENDPDFVALNAASVVLGISDIPWGGPVAGVRLAEMSGKVVINPLYSKLAEDKEVGFSSFISGNGSEKISMIEMEGDEADAKKIVEAYQLGLSEMQKIVDFQNKIIKEIGRPKADVVFLNPSDELKNIVKEFLSDKLESAVYVEEKTERQDNLFELKKDLIFYISQRGFSDKDLSAADFLFEEELNDLIHEKIIKENKRPDNRKLEEVREIHCETGLLPRTHGSAVFVRGSTQALAVVTLAPPGAEQLIETMGKSGKRRLMLHYNFPPYSVGEVGSFRGPGRRDIGHGALAEKAIKLLIPSQDDFPYIIRIVSEILSSNGSSSMASVCASSLALMDAGVPIKKPAAGIALGLMMDKNQKEYKILTDIQGPEDHCGDMDFKVAGTENGINAIQMDVKIKGIDISIIEQSLNQAQEARIKILEAMNKVISEPKKEISVYAPLVFSLIINPNRIGEVIGSGGKVINSIIESTGVSSINIEEDGRIYIAAKNKEAIQRAAEEIKSITREFEVGEIIEGEVLKVLDFGAIVDLGGGRDGMVHVSEIKENFVKNIFDVIKAGDKIKAKIIRVEPDGKIGLSIKQLSASIKS